MADTFDNLRDHYDVIVIGAGLAGMTAANTLARSGHSVLLVEQHYKLGGLATWFHRKGGHVFDISLHGFPVGMIKSCRRYWTAEIADSIVQLKHIRFDNPMFSLETTFNRDDFTKLLMEQFHVPAENVRGFFDAARAMSHLDDKSYSTRQLFEKFFPGRQDVIRLLMEPITYANGSTLEDPALTYGIVFSNFMSKGVYTFQGGSDRLIGLMREDMRKNGVDIRVGCDVQKVHVEGRKTVGATLGGSEKRGLVPNRDDLDYAENGSREVPVSSSHGGRRIGCRAVVSNSNLLGTIFQLVGEEHFENDFLEEARAVRLNNSSTQVYMALKPGEMIDENVCGDLLFSSTAPEFRTDMLLSRNITSRTYSFYYPRTRPGHDRCYVVASTNANYDDWAKLPPDEYEASKLDLIETTLDGITKYVPDFHEKLAFVEAATPRTFERYTKHLSGASFGTKFEGLAVSRSLPERIAGLYHAGSVGIIMSGWLGAVNYGVIVANDVDSFLMKK